MEFDEYDCLDTNLDPLFNIGPQVDVVGNNKLPNRNSNRKTDTKAAHGFDHSSKRSRTSSGSRRLSPTDDGDRDRNGTSSRERIEKRHRDGEQRKGRDRDRASDKIRKRDEESDRGRDHERERNRKHERSDRRRRSRSRSERQGKDREDVEREYKQRLRDIRPRKSKKEEVKVDVDPERDQRTVFAYQITQKADERDIFEFFSRAGKVRDVRLVMDRMSRRSRGVGYVEFVDAMSVPMAISLSGQPLLGQPVMVKPSEAEKNLVQPTASTGTFMNGAIGPYSGGARRLYVSNLHLNMKDDQLRQVFEAFGTVEMVQLPTEPETGHCKGFGFVQFARLEDARAAESLNEHLEIAGHLIKVSAVTDQILLETGVNTSDLDDYEGGGLTLNGSSRALLMQKLDRSGTLLSGSLVHASLPALPAPPVTVPSFDLIGVPGECLLLKNMFDPKLETESDFELDIKEDIKEECSKFGALIHIHVDKESAGFVYVRFKTTEAAMSAQRALHGRWFAGKMITATFMVLQDYEAKFPDSR